jgi:CheY-like chemotaxis protein/HPt (histidine-containing phosphotransfer) domain-containing protein
LEPALSQIEQSPILSTHSSTADQSDPKPGLQAVGGLLASLNHELRTSLNGVVGVLELLLDTELSLSQRSLASTAQDSVESLLTLVENIVDLSLADAGQLILSPGRIDLQRELHNTVAAYRTKAKDVDLALAQVPALFIAGDPERLRQVVTSLIGSALHASNGGRITVSVEAAEIGSACRLHIKVTASAAGEALSQLVAILDHSAAATAHALRRHGNAGLALALGTRLARLMGGSLSGDTGGLLFEASLPLAASPLAGMRMLVADAAHAHRSGLEELLQARGVRVDTCDDAMQVLGAFTATPAQAPYRVALIGQQLEGLDSEMLGATIKADPAYRDLHLLMLAEQATAADAQRLAAAGFAGVLVKPVADHAMLDALAAVLSPSAPGKTLFHAPALPGAINAPSFTGRRVLVADDNPVNRQVATRMLEKIGCVVDVAENGRQAVDMHLARPYELILMDCQMPELDGWEATTCIRAQEANGQHTPIVALTACSTPADRQQCRQSGMDDFISKPLRPQVLRDVLARLLPAMEAGIAESPADTLEAVHDMFGEDFAELARMYRADSPPRIAMLREAGAAGDAARVAKIAHALSGSSASIGASHLSTLCKVLELSSKAGVLDQLGAALDAIENEYDRVSARLLAMTGPNQE